MSITPSSSNQLRGAEQYFVQVSLVGVETPPPGGSPPGTLSTIDFPNIASVDLTNIIRETHQKGSGSKIYTFSVSDFFLKRADDFTELSRAPLVLACKDLSQGRSKFLTIFSGDSGIALSGSNAAVLQHLPLNPTFEIGKINLRGNDNIIYHPNNQGGVPPVGVPQEDQRLLEVLVRFSLNVSYLS